MDWEQIARAHLTENGQTVLDLFLNSNGERLSPKDVSDRTGLKLGSTSYHVRALHTRGLLVKSGTRQRRGAMQHYYRIKG